MVAVRRREWRWKAAIFIQCLCEPDAEDRLNACHIDTPVVSPVGPQRHNGVGIGEASVCPWPPGSATRRLRCIRDAFVCPVKRNLRPLKGTVHPNVEHRASGVNGCCGDIFENILQGHGRKESTLPMHWRSLSFWSRTPMLKKKDEQIKKNYW